MKKNSTVPDSPKSVENRLFVAQCSVDLLSMLPVGYVLVGWFSDQFDPTSVFLFGGLMMVVLNSLPLLLRGIREIE
jgi:hypothetical protein